MTAHAEDARQWVHAGCVAFAFLLRVLTWWQAAAMALVALAFNLFVLPRVGGRRLYRPVDEARGYPLGIVLYPIAVLLLILVFRTRLDLAAAAWAVLALGDGVATLAGRRIASPRWPWNRDKTIGGTLAFIAAGGAGAVLLAWWTRPAIVPQPSILFVIVAPLAAAIAAAFVETIPVRLDDNLSVAATAGGVLWIASGVSPVAAAAAMPAAVHALPWAIALNAIVAWAGWRAGTVSTSGAVTGAIVGGAIFVGAGLAGWLLLFATFAAATVASRLGLKRKRLLGIDEAQDVRRGPGNAIANCGVAVIAAVAALATPYRVEALAALAGALTAGGSDTVASEIGKAWGRSTYLITSFGKVKPGTPGAMSLEGTAAGLIAAFALAALAVALSIVPWAYMLPIVVGATTGAFVESVLAATLEGQGLLNNDMLNFINTAVAAVVTLTIG